MAQKSKPWNKPLYDAYRYHFGFSFSGGMLNFRVNHVPDFGATEIKSDGTEGFKYDSVLSIEGQGQPILGASVVGVLKLNNNFDLRFAPGLAFGQRDLTYYMLSDEFIPEGTWESHTMKIESTYIMFPMLVKYRAVRQNNYRPYIIGGINYSLDLAARKKIDDDEKPKIRLERHDFFVEVGAGIDYYLPFFKFSTELKFSYGLMDIVSRDGMQQTSVFDKLGSKMVTLAIFFE